MHPGTQHVQTTSTTAEATVAEPWTPADVVEALRTAKRGRPPRQALKAAVEMRAEVAPLLVAELSRLPAELEMLFGPRDGDTAGHPFLSMAAYLLAAFDEPRGLKPLLDIYRTDPELAEKMIGDWVVDDLAGIVARCCDGSDESLDLIEQAIVDTSLDVITRSELLDAYGVIHSSDRASAGRLLAFVERLLDVPTDAKPDDWYDWLSCRASQIAHQLQAEHLLPRIEALFDRRLIDARPDQFKFTLMGRADVRHIYENGDRENLSSRREALQPDAIVETICSFRWFDLSQSAQSPREVQFDQITMAMAQLAKEGYATPAERRPSHDLDLFDEPYVRSGPKVGRNDPCHCGSGRKYKKCCLDEGRELDA